MTSTAAASATGGSGCKRNAAAAAPETPPAKRARVAGPHQSSPLTEHQRITNIARSTNYALNEFGEQLSGYEAKLAAAGTRATERMGGIQSQLDAVMSQLQQQAARLHATEAALRVANDRLCQLQYRLEPKVHREKRTGCMARAGPIDAKDVEAVRQALNDSRWYSYHDHDLGPFAALVGRVRQVLASGSNAVRRNVDHLARALLLLGWASYEGDEVLVNNTYEMRVRSAKLRFVQVNDSQGRPYETQYAPQALKLKGSRIRALLEHLSIDDAALVSDIDEADGDADERAEVPRKGRLRRPAAAAAADASDLDDPVSSSDTD